MSTVRFSVVIPTRERAETLRSSLRTCLDQAFDDYEVVVSDNFSSPATKAVVDEIGSPKVRYVRTPRPVAMSSNWENGVAHARGEYVTLLGDDDGLLPHALAHLDALARAHNPKAIRWALAFYTWPNFRLPGHENYLRVPLGNSVVERDGVEVIRQAVASLEDYEQLPMIYNSCVRRDVLDELRRRGGKVFAHPGPDLFSGWGIAQTAGRFLNTALPMSVRGLSGSSTGIAALFEPGKTKIEQEFHALNAADGLELEPSVPNLPVLAAYTADTFISAKRLLFPDLDVHVDRRKLAQACLNRVRVTEANWPAVIGTVRDTLKNDPELVAWFDATLADTPYTPPPPITYFKPDRLGFDGTSLHLDAAAFGVTDIAGAARLCEQILHYTGRVPETTLDDAESVARKIGELTAPLGKQGQELLRRALGWWEVLDQVSTLRDQVGTLQGQAHTLQSVCEEREAIITRLGNETREWSHRLQAERRWSVKRPLRVVKKLLRTLSRGRLTAGR